MKKKNKMLLCGFIALTLTLHIVGLCMFIATGDFTLWAITGAIILCIVLYTGLWVWSEYNLY